MIPTIRRLEKGIPQGSQVITDVPKKWKISFKKVGFLETVKHKFPLALLKTVLFKYIYNFLIL